jgi:hypothetical protein
MDVAQKPSHGQQNTTLNKGKVRMVTFQMDMLVTSRVKSQSNKPIMIKDPRIVGQFVVILSFS